MKCRGRAGSPAENGQGVSVETAGTEPATALPAAATARHDPRRGDAQAEPGVVATGRRPVGGRGGRPTGGEQAVGLQLAGPLPAVADPAVVARPPRPRP